MSAPQTITVTSSAFAEGQPIPRRHSCRGAGVSPPLSWTGVPDEAAALALVVDDPDAPRGTYTHWLVVDIDRDATGVAEGAVPAGGVEIRTSAGRPGYFGPCPPSGTHRYRFTVHALGAASGLAASASLAEALTAIGERSIGWGRLVGTFSAG